MIATMPIARAKPRPDVVEHVTAHLAADQQGHDVELAAGQLVGRGLGPERVPEQQDHRPEEGRRQDRQRDVAPELEGAGAHVLGRLAPVLA